MLARGLLNGSATAHGISMQKVGILLYMLSLMANNTHQAVPLNVAVSLQLQVTCSPVAAPMVTFSPHRVVTVSRARTVCWFANYATTLLPDREVKELDSSFNISQYDTEMGEKLVLVGNKEYHPLVVVDKITANKQKLKDALWVSALSRTAFPLIPSHLHTKLPFWARDDFQHDPLWMWQKKQHRPCVAVILPTAAAVTSVHLVDGGLSRPFCKNMRNVSVLSMVWETPSAGQPARP
jgi:hypothetical protein